MADFSITTQIPIALSFGEAAFYHMVRGAGLLGLGASVRNGARHIRWTSAALGNNASLGPDGDEGHEVRDNTVLRKLNMSRISSMMKLLDMMGIELASDMQQHG